MPQIAVRDSAPLLLRSTSRLTLATVASQASSWCGSGLKVSAIKIKQNKYIGRIESQSGRPLAANEICRAAVGVLGAMSRTQNRDTDSPMISDSSGVPVLQFGGIALGRLTCSRDTYSESPPGRSRAGAPTASTVAPGVARAEKALNRSSSSAKRSRCSTSCTVAGRASALASWTSQNVAALLRRHEVTRPVQLTAAAVPAVPSPVSGGGGGGGGSPTGSRAAQASTSSALRSTAGGAGAAIVAAAIALGQLTGRVRLDSAAIMLWQRWAR
eukprot:SAG31_NODE_4611_length_3098_cov_1.293098_1_plen_271_part_00